MSEQQAQYKVEPRQQIGGSHYQKYEHQPIAVMAERMSPEQWAGYLSGNCVKYILRWQDKAGVEDLKKCRWYLDELINYLESQQ
ncbi:MAG: DUF3310 domain-containing protein [Gammaproteobacteria bacterium SHHR-1]